jgi:hypothetical protein
MRKKNAYRVSVGNEEGNEGNGPVGRSKRGWEDNIKIDFREIGLVGKDLINMTR